MRWLAFAMMMLVGACATARDGVASGAGALDGRWVVDLSAKPGEPYTKLMELVLAPDGTVSGTFYDSDILAGRWKTDRGRTCASFRTTDGAGPYHTSACRVGSGVQGETWAEHRNFLFNWNATRAPASAG